MAEMLIGSAVGLTFLGVWALIAMAFRVAHKIDDLLSGRLAARVASEAVRKAIAQAMEAGK